MKTITTFLIILTAVLAVAQFACAQPTITVAFKNIPTVVQTSDPMAGTMVVTLAGFDKAVDLKAAVALVDTNHVLAAMPKYLDLHGRGNGSFTLSLRKDFDLYARNAGGSWDLRGIVSCTVNGKKIEPVVDQHIQIAPRTGDTVLNLVWIAAVPSTAKVGEEADVELRYLVANTTGSSRDVAVQEQFRVTGPVSVSHAPIVHKLVNMGAESEEGHHYKIKFSKPGNFTFSYEVTSVGAQPLVGEMHYVVTGKAAKALRWTNASVSPASAAAGSPFQIRLAYKAEDVVVLGEVKESITISGPGQLSSSKTRSVDQDEGGAGAGEWQARLSKPGDYTVKASISSPGYLAPDPKVWHVKVTKGSGSGKGVVYVRKDPVIEGNTKDVTISAQSFSYKWGEHTGSAKWNDPPATISDGDSITCKVEASGDSHAEVWAGWLACPDGKGVPVYANNVEPGKGSASRTDTFHDIGYAPRAEVQVSHKGVYSSGAVQVKWEYEKRSGAAGAGKSELTDITPANSSGSAPKSAVPKSANKAATQEADTSALLSDSTTAAGDPVTSQPEEPLAGQPVVTAVEAPPVVPTVPGQLTVTIEDGAAVIHEILNLSLAQQFKIAPEDKVVSIDDTKTDGLTLEQLQGLLGGARGTVVKLRILRADGETWDVTMKRG